MNKVEKWAVKKGLNYEKHKEHIEWVYVRRHEPLIFGILLVVCTVLFGITVAHFFGLL